LGDLGQSPDSNSTLSSVNSRDDIDFVILAGDIAYSFRDPRKWDTFFDFLDDQPMMGRLPMQVCPGNQDINYDEYGGRIFLAYEHRFRMPQIHPPKLGLHSGHFNPTFPPYPLDYNYGNGYYSFTYGPARIIMINAYSSMEPNSTQYGWIVSELEGVDRSVTPWVLAVLHVPIYNSFKIHQRDTQVVAARKHLEPVLVKHKVNMVFSGHVHAYLRTSNVAMGVVNPAGPVHSKS